MFSFYLHTTIRVCAHVFVCVLCVCVFATQTIAQPIKIDWVFPSSQEFNQYWERVHAGAQVTVERMRAQGIDIDVRYHPPFTHDNYHHAQLNRLLEIQSHAPDGIILVPVGQSMTPAVDALMDAGIAVVTIDRPLLTQKVVSQVLFDNYVAVQKQVRWVLGVLPETIRALILTGPEDNFNADARLQGVLSVLSEQSVHIVGIETAHWQRSKGYEVTKKWLSYSAGINVIFAGNDEMALGAVQAIEELGLTGISVAGFDGNADAARAIEAGRMLVTVDQQPELMAQRALEVMVAHLTGKALVEKRILIKDIKLMHAQSIEALKTRGTP